MMRLGVDIDGVLCDFTRGILRLAGIPLRRYAEIEEYHFLDVWGLGESWARWKIEPHFWLGLQPLESELPDCCVAYLTCRECPNEITERWLKMHGFPDLPLFNTPDKAAQALSLSLDGLVDDCADHFLAAEKILPASFLVSRPWNRRVVTSRRIHCLEELNWRI